MKWCVSFPEEEILVVRPSLVAICMGNRPAAKLLGVLLYRYSIRKEHKDDAENMNDVKAARGEKPDQDTTFRIYRRQAQLIKDMCDEITEKTLCDTAVPMLQLLGYLDLDETSLIYCYDVHLETIMQAMEAYKKGQASLEAFFLSHLQLEKVLIDLTLEKVLIGNKKKFLWTLEKVPMPLEKVLMDIRKSSNVKRGRKPKPQAPREAQIEQPQISIDCIKTEEESVVVTNTLQPDTDSQPTDTPTLPDVAPDYTTSPTIEQLSTATEQNVDKSASSDTHSQQSYSHGHNTSPATHIGVIPVFEVPMPPGVKIPDAPQVQAPPMPPKTVQDQPSDEARAIRRMYDRCAGYVTGHAEWEWKKMEEMARDLGEAGALPTKDDMQLVYDHLKATKQKHTIVHVWEAWEQLPTLKAKQVQTSTAPNGMYMPPESDLVRRMREMRESVEKKQVAR